MIFIRTSLILLLVLTSAAFAQEGQTGGQCALTPSQLSQMPELKGLRPGMTVEEVKALAPSLEMGPQDDFGLSKTSFSPDFNPKLNKAAFQGVRTISLDFLDGRVSSIWIGYNDSFKWKTIEDVVKALTQSLKLPNAWEAKGRGQQLTCGGLEIAVTMVAGSPTLRITDEPARKTWEQRRSEKAESEP